METTLTTAGIACIIATTAPCPAFFSMTGAAAASSPTHQPPLRPDAPYPAVSFSMTATRNDGSAVHR